jgi:hypothetical protein
MEDNDVQSQLDNLQGILEGLGGGKSTTSDGFSLSEFLKQITGFAGEHLNSENLRSMLEQFKSLINENVTREKLNSVVQTIQSAYNDN